MCLLIVLSGNSVRIWSRMTRSKTSYIIFRISPCAPRIPARKSCSDASSRSSVKADNVFSTCAWTDRWSPLEANSWASRLYPLKLVQVPTLVLKSFTVARPSITPASVQGSFLNCLSMGHPSPVSFAHPSRTTAFAMFQSAKRVPGANAEMSMPGAGMSIGLYRSKTPEQLRWGRNKKKIKWGPDMICKSSFWVKRPVLGHYL